MYRLGCIYYMLKKAFVPLKYGMYSVCKAKIFEREQFKNKNRPDKSILSIGEFKRMFKMEDNEDDDWNKD